MEPMATGAVVCNFALQHVLTMMCIKRKTLDEINCDDKLNGEILLLPYQIIDKYQWKEKKMLDKKSANYHTKYFCGGGKVT